MDSPYQDAVEFGRKAAVCAEVHQDLLECVTRHPRLYGHKVFDPVPDSVAKANVFGTPAGLTAGQLRIAARLSLWIFAVDWLIDCAATSAQMVSEIVRECRDVADGRPPAAPVGEFLGEILADLAAAPRWPQLRPIWRQELDRMLAASDREWWWKWSRGTGAAADPSLEAYLDNADNFGSTLVNVSHWIHTDGAGDPATVACLDELRQASRQVQQVLRLLNDRATYGRDQTWGERGDLNALMITDVVTMHRTLADLVEVCGQSLGSLEAICPGQADYLRRQLHYSRGFYAAADYWGDL